MKRDREHCLSPGKIHLRRRQKKTLENAIDDAGHGENTGQMRRREWMAHRCSVPRRRSHGGAARTRGQRQGTAASGPAATPAPLSAPCGPSSTQAFLPRGGRRCGVLGLAGTQGGAEIPEASPGLGACFLGQSGSS